MAEGRNDMAVPGMFGQMFGKVEAGRCRLSMTGGIAIKTENGYKTYDVEKGRLVNCNDFVLDVCDDMFFCVPAMKVRRGDIIIVNRKPKCVISVEKNRIEVFSYETDTIEFIVPERHVFMGNAYMFRKIVSVFGNGMKTKGGFSKMMKYMCLSQAMKGNGGMSQFLPLMMMGNGGFDMDDVFDFDMDGWDDEDEEATEEGKGKEA